MDLFQGILGWIGALLTGVLAVWLTGFFNRFIPSPQRTWLAIKNTIGSPPPHTDKRFRFVLCWLKGDTTGTATEAVEAVFRKIGGVELFRSARVVAASGAKSQWESAMRKGAGKVRDKWSADLAVVGSYVKEPSPRWHVWVVSRRHDDTFDQGPYEDLDRQDGFRKDLLENLVAEALIAVAPFADIEVLGQVWTQGLFDVERNTEKSERGVAR